MSGTAPRPARRRVVLVSNVALALGAVLLLVGLLGHLPAATALGAVAVLVAVVAAGVNSRGRKRRRLAAAARKEPRR